MPDAETEGVLIDTELVRRLVESQFPQWSELAVTAVEPGGWDNRTFRLGDALSARLPSTADYVPQIEKEHRWLPELAPQLPIAIPEPVALGARGDGYPWPWSIYRWLSGEPVQRQAIEGSTSFARSLGEFLIALQKADTACGPAAGGHSFHRGGSLAVYDVQTRTALDALAVQFDTAAAAAIWDEALASHWSGPVVWVHGDIAPGNLLIERGQLVAVIDFGCCAIGDPACDLAAAWTLFVGDARATFREALPLSEDHWRRARGWALWKAAIVAADLDGNQREAATWRRVLADLIAER